MNEIVEMIERIRELLRDPLVDDIGDVRALVWLLELLAKLVRWLWSFGPRAEPTVEPVGASLDLRWTIEPPSIESAETFGPF